MRRSRRWTLAALALSIAACSGARTIGGEPAGWTPQLHQANQAHQASAPVNMPVNNEAAAPEAPAPSHGVFAPEVNAPLFVVRATQYVASLTGKGSPSRTPERWNVAGTDLGFTFEMNGKTYIVFGDTWGRDGVEGDDWRSNTMGIIDPANGYAITEMVTGPDGEAKELLSSLKEPGVEYTVTPTSGIAVGQRMYLHYMSVRDWDEQWWAYKKPSINSVGYAYSDDYGQTWTVDETAQWPGETAFTQVAMVKDDGYIYVFGIGALRFGPAKLLRVPEDHLLEPWHYEYWAGDGWSKEPSSVADVVPAPVGELSVRWSPYHQRWLMMYTNEINHTVVLRTAERPEGPWDAERVVTTDAEFPSLYAPLMMPVTGPDIYFAMSIFYGNYNVILMRTRLEKQQ